MIWFFLVRSLIRCTFQTLPGDVTDVLHWLQCPFWVQEDVINEAVKGSDSLEQLGEPLLDRQKQVYCLMDSVLVIGLIHVRLSQNINCRYWITTLLHSYSLKFNIKSSWTSFRWNVLPHWLQGLKRIWMLWLLSRWCFTFRSNHNSTLVPTRILEAGDGNLKQLLFLPNFSSHWMTCCRASGVCVHTAKGNMN